MALFDNKTKVIAGFQKNIDDKNRAIRSYYDQIGRLYYGQYTDMNVDVTREINQRCENITKLKQDIEELEIKILYEKGLKRCPVCRTENNLEYDFCFRCGSKFDASATAAATGITVDPAPVAEAVTEAVPDAAPVAEAVEAEGADVIALSDVTADEDAPEDIPEA